MGGRSQREGIYVYIQLIHFIVQQKPRQHGKPITLKLKITNREDYIHLSEKKSTYIGVSLHPSKRQKKKKNVLRTSVVRLQM